MNPHFLCALKNRTLIKIWGKESFKFLQSLTTNDLNRIITEHDFQHNINYPIELNSNETESNYIFTNCLDVSQITRNGNTSSTKGIPTLFLKNNGKILFDCFIYNVKYIYEKKNFCFFFIDCYTKSVQSILNILEKRKLSCDVSFNHLKNVNVYQALPCISELYKWNNYKNNTKVEKDDHSYFLQQIKNSSNFFFSKDERHPLLGYRVYQMGNEMKKLEMKEELKKQQKNNIVKQIIKYSNNLKKENLIEDAVIYDYFKLNLGIVENLYSNHFYFNDDENYDKECNEEETNTTKANKEKRENQQFSVSNNIDNSQNEKKKKTLLSRKLRFTFKDLTPFDLSYDILNYLVLNKGCYVGQESINRIRNKILINKYELVFFINSIYYDTFVNATNEKEKIDSQVWINIISKDSLFNDFLKEVDSKNIDIPFLQSSFFLFKNLIANKENVITYQNEYNVYIQNTELKQKQGNADSNNIIGNVFFYNHVMGLAFLIKNNIADIKKKLCSESTNVYIKKEGNEDTKHKILLITLKHRKYK